MWLVGTHQRSRRGQGRRRHLLSSLVLLSRSSAPTDVMTTVVVPHESWRWLHMKVGATLAHTTSFLTQGTSSSNQTPWTYNRPLPPAWKTRNVLPGKLFLIPGAHWPITGARLPEEVFTFWGHERDMACELWTTERDKEVLVENGEPGLLGSWALMCVFSSFLHRTTRSGVLSPFTFYNLITESCGRDVPCVIETCVCVCEFHRRLSGLIPTSSCMSEGPACCWPSCWSVRPSPVEEMPANTWAYLPPSNASCHVTPSWCCGCAEDVAADWLTTITCAAPEAASQKGLRRQLTKV